MKIITTIFLFILAATCYSQNNYCKPSPPNGVNGHSIAHINLESLDTAFTGLPYQYFSATYHHETCFLLPGSSHTIYMTSGTHAVSTLGAWIDFNNDGDLNSSEKLGEFTTTTAGQIATITFTVPLNSNTGKLWLRVRSSNSSTLNSCNDNSSGETIDFIITVLNPFYEYNFPSGWDSSGTGNYYMDNINLENIDNLNTGGPNGPFYSDYSDQIAYITQCNTNLLFVSGNFSTLNDSAFAYIDYNSNGIFEDNERAGEINLRSGVSTDSIVLITPTIAGDFRMRIIYSSDSIITEVEDYGINVSSANISAPLTLNIGSDLYFSCDNVCTFYGCKGTANFYDRSCGVPTYRHWAVPGATPSTSTQKNPTFNFPTAGNYIITLIDSNTYGPDTLKMKVTISAGVTNVNLGSNTTVCTGDSLLLSAPAGSPPDDCYSYLWSTGATTRQIYVHQSGSYNVELSSCHYTDCSAFDTIVVSFSPLKYNVTGGGSSCSGGTGSPVGLSDTENGISYQLLKNGSPVDTPVIGTGNAITFGNQVAAGAYTVVATNTSLSCTLTMTGSVSINLFQPPGPFNVTGGGTICQGAAGVPIGLNNSEATAKYQLYRNGIITGTPVSGNGSVIQFPVQSLAGTYTVIATTNNSSCTSSMTGSVSVIVNPGPAQYSVIGSGNYCLGDSLPTPGLNDTEIGVSYRLFKNGSPVGNAIPGTGNAISFGIIDSIGAYTVIATSTSPACSSSMNGTINVNQQPIVYNVSGGGSFCSGGNGFDISVDHSDLNVNYRLYRNGIATGAPVSGNGNAISFPNNTIAGIYTVIATSNSSCATTMNGSATIVVLSTPQIYNVTGGGNFCSGSYKATIKLSDSNLGISYELYNNGTPTGIFKSGTDTAVFFSNIEVSGTYTVVALDTTTCKSTMLGTATFNLIPAPVKYTLTGGGIFCVGDSIDSLILDGSETWIRYQLYVDSIPVGNSLNGNGNPLNYGIPPVSGTYYVIGSNTITACYATMHGTPEFELHALPNVFNVTGGGHYCSGSNGVAVILDNSESAFNYQLFYNNAPLGMSVQGINGPLTFGNLQMEGFYTVVASGTDSSCLTSMNDTAEIVIDPLPSPHITTVLPDTVCIFSSPIGLSGEPTGGIFNGDGIVNDTLFPALAGPVTVFISYDYSDPVTHCSAYASGSVMVDLCIGIDENDLPAMVSIFPNPADNEIITKFFFNREASLSIELINDIGQTISYSNLNKKSGDFSYLLNTANLPDGFYLMKINWNNNILARKIIIHHQ